MSNRITIIGEIGINHNHNMEIIKKLIDLCVELRISIVKFQKRTVDLCYSKEFLDSPRESQFGKTVRDQKNGLELSQNDYDEINKYCDEKNIYWMASAWDIPSLVFLRQYRSLFNKVASAIITNLPLIEEIAKEKKYTYISTGMSTLQEIHRVVDIFKKYRCAFELMVCTSTYPMKDEHARLGRIISLRREFNCNVGYSGHETGLQISLAAVVLGASSIERHITLDRTMEGSDHAASLEPNGLRRLVRDIHIIKNAIGNGVIEPILEEIPIMEKLRYWENN